MTFATSTQPNTPTNEGLAKLLLPPWRVGSNVRSASDKQLEFASGACVTLEIIFAGIVVVGVLGEFAVALRHPAYDSFWEIWSPRVGNALVAIGVAVETVFLGIGHFIQEELSRRAKEELGEANDRAAQAHERAANAERETAKLRADFGWRVLSAIEMRALITELSTAAGPVAISFVEADVESRSYVQQFVFAFRYAKWSVVIEAATYDELTFGIQTPKPGDGPMELPARTLSAALTAAGLKFASMRVPGFASARIVPFPPRNRYAEDTARLYIGPKLRPWILSDEQVTSAVANTLASAPDNVQ